ncbi:gamma-glutamyl phosphate reductase [Candidatus Apopatosoma intestinale]|nr:gamma-glutamyl phosphate reductase [Candidatus Apopatosoma intestinale]
MTTAEILKNANAAKAALAALSAEEKNKALLAMADALTEDKEAILAANASDMEKAEAEGRFSRVMLDRLSLNEARIAAMAEGIRAVAELEDPVGVLLSHTVRPNGLEIDKVSVPLGVIAIIYESRPNVTSDAAALCLRCRGALPQERQCLHSARRQGSVCFIPCHSLGDAPRTCRLRSPDGFCEYHRRYGQRKRRGADARARLCRSAYPARRRRTYPRLRGEGDSSLHRNRDRHMPYLC